MFSSKTKAERTASQAWDYLSSAMTTAGDSAREVGGQTADAAARFADQANKLADQATRRGKKAARKATKKADKRGSALVGLATDKTTALAGAASAKADKAWARANAAADALAGRKHRPWGLIIGATLLGGAVGFAAAGALRAAQEREAENGELEMAGNAVIVTPSYDD